MLFCQYCLAMGDEAALPFHCETEQEFFAHLREVHRLRVLVRTADGYEVESISSDERLQ
jgi:hypothetical protein